VLARIGRRVLDFLIGFFALLGFALVPLGDRTALDHVKAIFATGPAVHAGRELLEAGKRLRQRLLAGDATHRAPTPQHSADGGLTGATEPNPEPPPLQVCAADAGADASL
jgi:hypothetical protein